MEAPAGSSLPSSPLAVHRCEALPKVPSQADIYLTPRTDANVHCESPLLDNVPSTSGEAPQCSSNLPCEVPLLGVMDLPPEPSSPPPDYNVVVGQDGKTGLMLHASYSLLNLDNKSDNVSINMNICRICHMPGDETNEGLISPCRCAGTLQFIHNTCLMKWLEITTKKSRKPPKCELCHFQYNRHKKFKFQHLRLPHVSRRDKVLHSIFLLYLLVMVACAIATVLCFLSDKGRISKFPRNKVDLTTEEIVTLSCGVLFFVSFFIAMSVQIKAKHTVYQLFVKLIMQNLEWEIDEYDKEKDSLFTNKKTMI